uniref:Deoxyribonuclease-2-alpha n=1 Tax=Castor canadensis TaxID=51338 RepID=A0A8C0WZU9_CASCN
MATLNLLLLAALLCAKSEALSCHGDSGQPVNWFVVYKLPAVSGSGDAAMRGLRYKYMDESTGGWRDGAGSINSSNGAVGRSLPLYRSNSSQVSCFWIRKGASGWSTACHASLQLLPLGRTAGLIMPKPTGRPYSACPFPSPSSGLASS